MTRDVARLQARLRCSPPWPRWTCFAAAVFLLVLAIWYSYECLIEVDVLRGRCILIITLYYYYYYIIQVDVLRGSWLLRLEWIPLLLRGVAGEAAGGGKGEEAGGEEGEEGGGEEGEEARGLALLWQRGGIHQSANELLRQSGARVGAAAGARRPPVARAPRRHCRRLEGRVGHYAADGCAGEGVEARAVAGGAAGSGAAPVAEGEFVLIRSC